MTYADCAGCEKLFRIRKKSMVNLEDNDYLCRRCLKSKKDEFNKELNQ